jgi:hypothetical protein
MNFSIIPTENFIREARQLAKKHRSLKSDLVQLRKELIENPHSGIHLGHNVYKIRLAIASKGKGKSGGARVITCVFKMDQEIYLLSIYDKSVKENISDADLKRFLSEVTFLKKT